MVSVIIPTLNAEKYLPDLLRALKAQKTDKELEIIIVDSKSDDRTIEIVAAEAPSAPITSIRLLTIDRKEFDHGGTRNRAVKEAKGDIICFLTQDALPENENYIEELIKGFEDKDVKMISGRQVARPDANPVEKLTRAFNYPEKSFVRDKNDIKTLGIKAYFFSDACAAYKREVFDEFGGFEEPILTNEDMLMAARVINKGFKIGYAGNAKVLHSHNFSLSYQYKRNFDVAVFLEQHKDEIDSGSTTGEGMKMVLFTIKELLKGFHILSVFRCVFESGAKFLGNRAGKKYKTLTKEEILKKTSNKGYWEKIL